MKKFVVMLVTLMFMAAPCFATGVNGISIDGAAGVSAGSYVGEQTTISVGVNGTSGYVSIAEIEIQGASVGTSANGSIVSGGIGRTTDHSATGTFSSSADGFCKAKTDNTKLGGTYKASSTVTVGTTPGSMGISTVSIEGGAGVSTGSYTGTQTTLSTGLQGTSGYVSIAEIKIQGVSVGTSAHASVVDGNICNSNTYGTGYFRAVADGSIYASSGDASMCGNYHSSSTVNVSVN